MPNLLPESNLDEANWSPASHEGRKMLPNTIHFRGNYGNRPVGRWTSPGPLIVKDFNFPHGTKLQGLFTGGRVGLGRFDLQGSKRVPVDPQWLPSPTSRGIMPKQEGGKGFRVLIQTPNRILIEPSADEVYKYGFNNIPSRANELIDSGKMDFSSHSDFGQMRATDPYNAQHVDPKSNMKILAEFDRMPFAHEYLAFMEKYPNATPEDVADYFAHGANQNVSGKIVNFAGDERSVAAKHGWVPKGKFYSAAGLISALGLAAAAEAGVPGARKTQSFIDKYDPYANLGRVVEKQATKSPWWNRNVIDPIAGLIHKSREEKAKADANVFKLQGLLHSE